MVSSENFRRALLPSPSRERPYPTPPSDHHSDPTSFTSFTSTHPTRRSHEHTPTHTPPTVSSSERRRSTGSTSVFERLSGKTTLASRAWTTKKHITPKEILPKPIVRNGNHRGSRQTSSASHTSHHTKQTVGHTKKPRAVPSAQHRAQRAKTPKRELKVTRPKTPDKRMAAFILKPDPEPQRKPIRPKDSGIGTGTAALRRRKHSVGRTSKPSSIPTTRGQTKRSAVSPPTVSSQNSQNSNTATTENIFTKFQALRSNEEIAPTPSTSPHHPEHKSLSAPELLDPYSATEATVSTPALSGNTLPKAVTPSPSLRTTTALTTTTLHPTANRAQRRVPITKAKSTPIPITNHDDPLPSPTSSSTSSNASLTPKPRAYTPLPLSPIPPSPSSDRPRKNSGPWGKNFVNEQGVGKWSLHFLDASAGPDLAKEGEEEIVHGAYVSFEHPDCDRDVLRNGTPLPKRLSLGRISYDANDGGGGTFRGGIDFVEAYGSTWGGFRTFTVEMTFDTGFWCVLRGTEIWRKELHPMETKEEEEEEEKEDGPAELRQSYGEGRHVYLNSALRERIVGEEEARVMAERLREEGATMETVELVRDVMMGKNPLN